MKKLILLVLLAFAPLVQAKEVDITGGAAVTTGGTITRGLRGVVFIFSSDFVGTIAGTAFTGAADGSFSPPIQPGDTLAAMTYTVSAGSMRIIPVR